MFDKSVYVIRRKTLLAKMANSAAEGKRGIALFIGNAEAPAQYKDNCYKFRQDSTWLYLFGIDQPLYAAVIDLDNGEETIFADDVAIGDIIWMYTGMGARLEWALLNYFIDTHIADGYDFILPPHMLEYM